ncbi:hypothetical protein [Streptomyces coelicoflavus]|uniref:hypothetical protein n=1 Tax=Streptomyces coelicoflavus TaxID=285562 RepID=UPI0036384626
MEPATLLMTCVLMFIGGGSAGTAGGIKVTTFAVLLVATSSPRYAASRTPPSSDADWLRTSCARP